MRAVYKTNKRAGGRGVQRPLNDGGVAVWREATLLCNHDLDAPANKKLKLQPDPSLVKPFDANTLTCGESSGHTEEQYSYSYLNRNMRISSSDRLSALMPAGGYHVRQKPPKPSLITSSCSESSQVEKDGGKTVRNEKLEVRNEKLEDRNEKKSPPKPAARKLYTDAVSSTEGDLSKQVAGTLKPHPTISTGPFTIDNSTIGPAVILPSPHGLSSSQACCHTDVFHSSESQNGNRSKRLLETEQFKFDGGHQVTDDDDDITIDGCHGIQHCLPEADN